MSLALERDGLDATATAAIDAAAAAAPPGHTIDTRDVLLLLMKLDPIGEWHRIWLHFASLESVEWAVVGDPRPAPGGHWRSVPMTETCAAAIGVAVRLAERYRTGLVSAGLLALGLVADPASAACQSLTGGNADRYAELLERLQDAIVGAGLGGLAGALRELTTGAAAPTPLHEADRYGPAELARMDSLGLLASAIDTCDDPNLTQRYGRLLLDAETLEQVRPHVAQLSGPSAADLVKRARDRFDVSAPDARQIIVAATTRAGEQIRKALWLLGIDPVVVAYEAADAESRQRRDDNPVTDATATLSMLSGLFSVAVSVFVGRYAVTTHHWWALSLIILVWTGHPAITLVFAGVAWWATDNVTAIAALALAVTEVVQLRSEQRGALFRTGIVLSIQQLRTHVRLGSPSYGLVTTIIVARRRGRRIGRLENGGDR